MAFKNINNEGTSDITPGVEGDYSPDFFSQMSTPIKGDISQETKEICNKMAIFKQRYKEYSNKVKSLEEALAVVNIELSLTKNENARLKEEIKTKQTSIAKYQLTLKELVQVEERYCKLLQEKKDVIKELATEKKIRLEIEKRHDEEKKEIKQSMQEELRILKEDSEMKEEAATVEYSQTIDAKNKEIDSLKKKLLDSEKMNEEMSILRQDLKHAQKEIIDLRREASNNNEPSITKEILSSNKKIDEDKLKKPDGKRDSTLENEKGTSNGWSGIQTEETDVVPNKCLSIYKQPLHPMPASHFYQVGMCSPRHWPLSSASLLSGSVRSTKSESLRSATSDSQQMSSPKKVSNPLEVFRLPTRPGKRSPVRRKRKLYTRSDDTL
ncbi:hypothetical protein GE061_014670 [Apolygus lucorum]|uniref:Uncharacterized protein n=1 Tax=Apolygus lucorum TaxID=248454 RepID=A0A8S9XKZ6_APOLU|nr:hypothetical protein GE061_014670 [Apolygus lucorum]